MSFSRRVYHFLFSAFLYHGRRLLQIVPALLAYIVLSVLGYDTYIATLSLIVIGAAFAMWLEKQYVTAQIIERQHAAANDILALLPVTAAAAVFVLSVTLAPHPWLTRLRQLQTRRVTLKHVTHDLLREKERVVGNASIGISLEDASDTESIGTVFIQSQ